MLPARRASGSEIDSLIFTKFFSHGNLNGNTTLAGGVMVKWLNVASHTQCMILDSQNKSSSQASLQRFKYTFKTT